MNSQKFMHKLFDYTKNNIIKIIAAMYFGPFISWLTSMEITRVIFSGKELFGRSTAIQLLLSISYSTLFSITIYLLLLLYEFYARKNQNFEKSSVIDKKKNLKVKLIWPILIFWTVIMLWVCVQTGIQHDHLVYNALWRQFLNGEDPWPLNGYRNAYGPFHTIAGYLLPLGDVGPKLFFCSCLLLANILILKELIKERGITGINLIYLIAIPTNALFIGIGFVFGLNDALVAAFIGFAVILRLRGKNLFSGICIGIAALIKYYPILLLPFFAVERKNLNFSTIASGTTLFIVGFVSAQLIWNEGGPINAIVFGSNRGTDLSLIHSLLVVFPKSKFVNMLAAYNTIFVLAGVFLTFILVWIKKVNWLEGATLGYLVVLTIYKVGHQNFYLPFLILLICLPLIKRESADKMAIFFAPIAIFFSILHMMYIDIIEAYWLPIRDYSGFIIFSVNIICIATYIISNLKESKTHRVKKSFT